MRQADGKIAPAEGYEWATADPKSMAVKLKPGLALADNGQIVPMRGYEWASFDPTKLTVRLIRTSPYEAPPPSGPVLTRTWVEKFGANDDFLTIYVANDSKVAIRFVAFVFEVCDGLVFCVNNAAFGFVINPGMAHGVHVLARATSGFVPSPADPTTGSWTSPPYRLLYHYRVEAVP